jgi:hypothetical protein
MEQAARDVEEGARTIEQAAEQVAGQSGQSSEQMTQGLQQMAQGFQQMAQGSATPVDFEQLLALLPTIDGWTQADPRGEQLTMPVKYSKAEAIYRRDDSRIEVVITDSALSQMLLAPMTMFMASGFSERSSEGFKRSARIDGQPAFEEWNSGSNRGEVTVVVANRFIVTAQGSDVAELAPVRAAVEAVDLGKLAGLK